MRKVTLSLVLVLMAGVLAFGQKSAAEKPKLEMLSWLAGCWTSQAGPRQIDENWMKPAGGTMLGMGRTVAKGQTREYEFMRLHQEGDDIFFTAIPSGQAETSFKLTTWSGGKFVFENPQHDFPRRVIYRKNADGSLTASVDGGPGTKANTFAYRAMPRK